MTTPIGTAIYLELVTSTGSYISHCSQILLCPEHEQTRSAMYVRHLSTNATRKQWRHRASSSTLQSVRDGERSDSDVTAYIAHSAVTTLDRLINRGYVLREPIFVEFSLEDLDDVRQGKTPYRVMSRVNKVRDKVHGLSKSLVGATATVPATPASSF